MSWKGSSIIDLHAYKAYQEKENYIVELVDREDFFEMPPICVDALAELKRGASVAEVEGILIAKYPDEEVDMPDFIEQLLELGLIYKLDGEVIRPPQEKSSNHESKYRLSSYLGKILFSKAMLCLYALIFIVNILIFVLNPGLFPHYQDIFIFESISLNILNLAIVTLCIICFHELGHVLAVRKYNLPTRLGLGHRLFLVVVETEMTHVWKLARKERNIPFIAGVCFDQLLLCLALMAQLFIPGGHYIFLGIAGVIVFEIVILFIYQCCFYMKTDIYYILENMLGTYNLLENSKQWLKNRLQIMSNMISRLLKKKRNREYERVKPEKTSPYEERVISYYALFYMVGMLFSIGLAVIYFIPQLYYSISVSLAHLSYPVGSALFWDGVIFMGNLSIMLLLLLYSLYRKYILQREES